MDYAHCNLRILEISMSSRVDGLLGASTRLKLDQKGNPILKAFDKDGAGVLEHPPQYYKVDTITSEFPLYDAWVQEVLPQQ